VGPAADDVGMARSTAWHWLNSGRAGDARYAGLWADVVKVRAERTKTLLQKVDGHADMDPATARWLLERHAPAEFSLNGKVEAAVVERMRGLLDALEAECDSMDPTGVTSDRLRRAAARVLGSAEAVDDEEGSIDVDAEVVERALPSGDTE
jgi:hypothetical protein